MKKRIMNLLKYNKAIYFIYFYAMSFFINVLKLFIKPDAKLILFNSFAGRKYDDSPKAIFEHIKKDDRFKNTRLVWAFHEPDKFEVEGAEKIKTDGLRYFITALKAHVWVTNSSVERGLRFKGKKTFYLNTWHGSPVKRMGADIVKGNQSFKSRGKNLVDLMNTQSRFEEKIFIRCFGIPKERFLEVGLPRNDELAYSTKEYREQLRKQFNIPEEKKVLLYCPTFREYEKDNNHGIILVPPMDLKKWECGLGSEYVLLFRAHYEVTKAMIIQENAFVRDVTNYPSLNDLMILSDILISDYSSIYFDYSIMDKAMIHFSYDFDKYERERGMYFDIRDYISGAGSEDEVINRILNMNYAEEVEKTRIFRSQYMDYYGDATQQTVDCISEVLFGKGE